MDHFTPFAAGSDPTPQIAITSPPSIWTARVIIALFALICGVAGWALNDTVDALVSLDRHYASDEV